MLPISQIQINQKPLLIHTVHEDDKVLLNTPDAEWFRALYYFPWEKHRNFGAEYYDALYEFNKREERKRLKNQPQKQVVLSQSKEDARQELLFNRATMQVDKEKRGDVLYEVAAESKQRMVSPLSISPGVVPFRLGGKRPKCFFALLKSFLGTALMGFPCEPEKVSMLLKSNPSFVRVCGFAPKGERDEYCSRHIPSERKLQQFDQIMSEWGLWDKMKIALVTENIETGAIKIEKEVVGDTTHYYAYSGFETVKYKDEDGKEEQKKSQSKLTKRCRCQDRDKCEHDWVLADEGAGTIVKSITKMYWGHKASIVGFPRQGVPLDARAVLDGPTHDGETYFPHVEKVFDTYPVIEESVKRALYDSACDSRDLKDKFMDKLGLELKASLNPRRKNGITDGLPRGMEKITPYGVVICNGGHEMDYKGMRYEKEKFIYHAPTDTDGEPVCSTCLHQVECCPNSLTGRMINISFGLLPHIDTEDPPMAKRFKAIMTRRPSVERMIKRLKCDIGDDRLSKRGNLAFQAYLDKTMIAFHLLLQN
ncbi:dTDP-4-dehydrorhamnose 3,5-epimerase and related enzymes [Candidatus Scalindua japonica]|uniref:dTDP-4-dehydrorhamnose 3,5-epimerase and related enzymes n=1 Tax=Candidatus Scalindua japonica TaxID=1284222 RepID=A0A286U348_9BACT|nr:hypothetical protein [Candidatus Scalindua japonica]GAX62558.1 dTDP-4-dehydrorhamnose 3,5-epimerase and related enzymes [Candidatus Scalindua japonica]